MKWKVLCLVLWCVHYDVTIALESVSRHVFVLDSLSDWLPLLWKHQHGSGVWFSVTRFASLPHLTLPAWYNPSTVMLVILFGSSPDFLSLFIFSFISATPKPKEPVAVLAAFGLSVVRAPVRRWASGSPEETGGSQVRQQPWLDLPPPPLNGTVQLSTRVFRGRKREGRRSPRDGDLLFFFPPREDAMVFTRLFSYKTCWAILYNIFRLQILLALPDVYIMNNFCPGIALSSPATAERLLNTQCGLKRRWWFGRFFFFLLLLFHKNLPGHQSACLISKDFCTSVCLLL